MKSFFLTILSALMILSLSAQCEFVDVSVSSSSTTTVQLYTPAFFLIPSGFANQNHWLVKDEAGNTIHEETTSGVWADQSFSLFNHSIPLTESMEVCLTITNTDTGEVCGLCNTLTWVDNISNWIFEGTVGGAPLPVELVNFSGKTEGNTIELQWATASEINNRGFEVERSNDRDAWRTISFIEGHGTTTQTNNYQIKDRRPSSGANYYRLKQIDFDGAFEYSKIIMVEYHPSKRAVQVFPNPSKGKVNIQIDIPQMERTQVQVSDNLGRIIWASGKIEGEAFFRAELEIESNGIYYVTTQMGHAIIHKPLVITSSE